MSDDEKDDDKFGTFEELLALDPDQVDAIKIGDGPWGKVHTKKQLQDAIPASPLVQ